MEHTTRAEKMKILIFIFVFLSCLPSALSPISYAILHFPQPQNWELPLVMEYLPFKNQKLNNFSLEIILFFFSMHFRTDTYFGFYIAYIIQFFMCYYYTYWVATFLLLYISLYFCAEAMKIDLMEIVSELNRICAEKSKEKSTKIQTQKKKLLIKDWINLHNNLLEYLF